MGFKGRMSKNNMLAICIGIVYLWFGMLKFFPGLSPAEVLAKDTINQLTFGFVPSNVSIIMLAIWETAIGVFLIGNLFNRATLILALVHITLTFSPLIFFPELTFDGAPFHLTLLGQYIIKNVIIAGMLVVLLNENKKARVTVK